jgi:tetratricopeptide (TPR) repeat protein
VDHFEVFALPNLYGLLNKWNTLNVPLAPPNLSAPELVMQLGPCKCNEYLNQYHEIGRLEEQSSEEHKKADSEWNAGKYNEALDSYVQALNLKELWVEKVLGLSQQFGVTQEIQEALSAAVKNAEQALSFYREFLGIRTQAASAYKTGNNQQGAERVKEAEAKLSQYTRSHDDCFSSLSQALVLLQDPNANAIIVLDVTGDVIYRNPEKSNKWLKLVKGIQLNKGDQVQTGLKSKALLMVRNSTSDAPIRILVRSSSFATLSQAFIEKNKVEAEFRMDPGSLYIDINDKKEVEIDMRVRSPIGVASVRGTVFSMSHDAQKNLSEVIVLIGAVEIATLPTGKNRLTLNGPGSCDKGGIRVTIDKDENISPLQVVALDPEDWPICKGG